MRIAAQFVRGPEDGAGGLTVPDLRRHPCSGEAGRVVQTGQDMAPGAAFRSGSLRSEALRDEGAENGANDFLPVLPGTESLAVAAGAWLVLAFHCEPDKAPRVQLIVAENIAVAGRVAPFDRPVCAVPAAAIERWNTSQRVGEIGTIGIEPGMYFLTPRLEDLCRMFVQVSGAHVANRAHRSVRFNELVCETIDAFVQNALFVACGGERLAATERDRLDRARRHIVTHYADKLTICQIARAAGIGRAKLIRGFRELYGCTVHEMMTTTRLEVAATMLRGTLQPISRIAFECGYHSSAAFARAFAKYYGSSPSAFRSEE
ncbi:helix-turn-helix transcriptional regulator [Sphingomonas sp. AP4-R1]|uniref:helix-turn-helix transcriptional regulator n=1 Tax=Sphingomonas sp. AP4-R1 TaxID=2735134 RepID=UPI001493C538|nr:AraC family transcriptional regulator [Sphingomonas sp. AP4-R1]QJU58307.1 helix-turn-helix transcriptional regulator [Sphingomonas sp. AP4-R1]